MTKKILLVDDEPNVLQGYKRHLRKSYDLHLAVGGAAAMEAVKNEGPFAVVVSDMQMPEMNGVELLRLVQNADEHIVRIMLTGNADQKTAVDAVNEGNIFRFLSKPCSPEMLAKTLDSGLEHYRLITAEAELLNKTLSGSVRMLTQVLSLAMPSAFGLTQEARMLARQVGQQLEVKPAWEIEMAAMLMRIGCVSLPADIVDRYLSGEQVSPEQEKLISESSSLGRDLVSAIPRLEGVANLIASQNDPPKDPTPMASRVLKAVGDFQRFRCNRTPLSALRVMEGRTEYDPQVLEHLDNVVRSMYQNAEVTVAQLAEGMVLEENVVDLSGRVLIAKGNEIHETLIQKLNTLRRSGSGVREPIQVRKMASTRVPNTESSLAG